MTGETDKAKAPRRKRGSDGRLRSPEDHAAYEAAQAAEAARVAALDPLRVGVTVQIPAVVFKRDKQAIGTVGTISDHNGAFIQVRPMRGLGVWVPRAALKQSIGA